MRVGDLPRGREGRGGTKSRNNLVDTNLYCNPSFRAVSCSYSSYSCAYSNSYFQISPLSLFSFPSSPIQSNPIQSTPHRQSQTPSPSPSPSYSPRTHIYLSTTRHITHHYPRTQPTHPKSLPPWPPKWRQKTRRGRPRVGLRIRVFGYWIGDWN